MYHRIARVIPGIDTIFSVSIYHILQHIDCINMNITYITVFVIQF